MRKAESFSGLPLKAAFTCPLGWADWEGGGGPEPLPMVDVGVAALRLATFALSRLRPFFMLPRI